MYFTKKNKKYSKILLKKQVENEMNKINKNKMHNLNKSISRINNNTKKDIINNIPKINDKLLDNNIILEDVNIKLDINTHIDINTGFYTFKTINKIEVNTYKEIIYTNQYSYNNKKNILQNYIKDTPIIDKNGRLLVSRCSSC